MSMTAKSHIYLGIGGWTFEPWRGVFYPKGLPHSKELAYASEHLTSIEVNGTFYRTQSPATYRKWASEVPDGFVFSIKGSRYVTNRRVLSEAGESIERFLNSGVTELGDKLGPLLWQFAPFKKFDEADFGGFLELLPGHIQRPAAPPRRRGAPRQLQDAGVHRAAAEIQHRRRVHRSRNLSEHRRHHRRLRLCAPAAGRGHDPDRLSAEGARCLGQAAPHLGGGQGAGRPAARRSEAQTKGRAARRVCLCDPRGQGARAGGGDGADRAA